MQYHLRESMKRVLGVQTRGSSGAVKVIKVKSNHALNLLAPGRPENDVLIFSMRSFFPLCWACFSSLAPLSLALATRFFINQTVSENGKGKQQTNNHISCPHLEHDTMVSASVDKIEFGKLESKFLPHKKHPDSLAFVSIVGDYRFTTGFWMGFFALLREKRFPLFRHDTHNTLSCG
ncbi:hypothetical protein ZHAS_00016747 [Anopheles sinensis]|uniref:Uncharacterized protein n=1 Tax=Anopheles sinensis TaxID=74873 RepID=A0A084WEU8_ANOSI|nr:hypothetical protein ZHAS_00016747 [Anopheles sinensis]